MQGRRGEEMWICDELRFPLEKEKKKRTGGRRKL